MPESLPSKDSEISLREYLESRLDGIVDLIEARFKATGDAVDKAERSMNERLSSMNEFRETLRDQAGKFATITQLDDRMEAALQQISRVEERVRNIELHGASRENLDEKVRARQEAVQAVSDRVSRLEKFMWILMGAFILLQIIARYLPSLGSLPK